MTVFNIFYVGVEILLTPEQCRAGRALLGMSQMALSEAAGVSHKPLVEFERGKTKPQARTVEALQRALEAAGVQFIPENGGGAGVRLRKPTESR